VQLAVLALTASLILGTSTAGPASLLPATQPGLGRDEGTFMVTAADDGSRVAYFIAGNVRHTVLPADMQLELERNPLWPVRPASREDVLAHVEGAPVGTARAGLIGELVALDQPTADAESDSSGGTTYVLRAGDTLTHVSAAYGTTVDAIVAANSMTNPNRVYSGRTVFIPTVDVVPSDLAEAPTEDGPVADESAAAASYTVKPGDSAIGVARRLGVDVEDLLAANGVANRDRVYVGQVLTIPN
jgi:LysM repeat protein